MLRKNPQIWLFLSIFTFFYGRTDLKKRIFQPFWLLTATTEYWTGMLRNMYGNHSPSVVYLLIPTSNHNNLPVINSSASLYIFWFLHQTTTPASDSCQITGCISFDSYIKPQLFVVRHSDILGCISFDSYIKPQREGVQVYRPLVVYLLIPTSNHNVLVFFIWCKGLYIFWFLHQTTTGSLSALLEK